MTMANQYTISSVSYNDDKQFYLFNITIFYQ
jgi:hypothetical protein